MEVSRRGFLKGMVAAALSGGSSKSDSNRDSNSESIFKRLHSASKISSNVDNASKGLGFFNNPISNTIKDKVDSFRNKVEPARNFLANSDKVRMSRRQFLKSTATTPVRHVIQNTADGIARKSRVANFVMDPSSGLNKRLGYKSSRIGKYVGLENINDKVLYNLQSV